jgi:hypothetical protein
LGLTSAHPEITVIPESIVLQAAKNLDPRLREDDDIVINCHFWMGTS